MGLEGIAVVVVGVVVAIVDGVKVKTVGWATYHISYIMLEMQSQGLLYRMLKWFGEMNICSILHALRALGVGCGCERRKLRGEKRAE